MSRASAAFYFDDGKVLYGIYEGTCDIMQQFMSESREEPWDWYYCRNAWKDRGLSVPECPHEGEHVVAFTDYGNGWYWHGKACAECKVFKGPRYLDEYEEFRTLAEAQAVPILAAAKPATEGENGGQ